MKKKVKYKLRNGKFVEIKFRVNFMHIVTILFFIVVGALIYLNIG